MGFNFKTASTLTKNNKHNSTRNADEQNDFEYRERARNERKRFETATDGLFWFALCFKTKSELDLFSKKFKMPKKFVSGDEFAKALESLKPEKLKTGFPTRTIGAMADDPLADVHYSGNLEKDCMTEALALLGALKNAHPKEPVKYSSDSDQWKCVFFRNQDEKLEFLKSMGLLKYGSNYIDASKWMRSV